MNRRIADYFGVTPKSEAYAKMAACAFGGALLGSITALLLAPQTGEETRDDIKHAANVGIKKVREGVDKASEYAQKKSEEAKSKLKEVQLKANAKGKEVVADVAKGVAETAEKVADTAEKVEKKNK